MIMHGYLDKCFKDRKNMKKFSEELEIAKSIYDEHLRKKVAIADDFNGVDE